MCKKKKKKAEDPVRDLSFNILVLATICLCFFRHGFRKCEWKTPQGVKKKTPLQSQSFLTQIALIEMRVNESGGCELTAPVGDHPLPAALRAQPGGSLTSYCKFSHPPRARSPISPLNMLPAACWTWPLSPCLWRLTSDLLIAPRQKAV